MRILLPLAVELALSEQQMGLFGAPRGAAAETVQVKPHMRDGHMVAGHVRHIEPGAMVPAPAPDLAPLNPRWHWTLQPQDDGPSRQRAIRGPVTVTVGWHTEDGKRSVHWRVAGANGRAQEGVDGSMRKAMENAERNGMMALRVAAKPAKPGGLPAKGVWRTASGTIMEATGVQLQLGGAPTAGFRVYAHGRDWPDELRARERAGHGANLVTLTEAQWSALVGPKRPMSKALRLAVFGFEPAWMLSLSTQLAMFEVPVPPHMRAGPHGRRVPVRAHRRHVRRAEPEPAPQLFSRWPVPHEAVDWTRSAPNIFGVTAWRPDGPAGRLVREAIAYRAAGRWLAVEPDGFAAVVEPVGGRYRYTTWNGHLGEADDAAGAAYAADLAALGERGRHSAAVFHLLTPRDLPPPTELWLAGQGGARICRLQTGTNGCDYSARPTVGGWIIGRGFTDSTIASPDGTPAVVATLEDARVMVAEDARSGRWRDGRVMLTAATDAEVRAEIEAAQVYLSERLGCAVDEVPAYLRMQRIPVDLRQPDDSRATAAALRSLLDEPTLPAPTVPLRPAAGNPWPGPVPEWVLNHRDLLAMVGATRERAAERGHSAFRSAGDKLAQHRAALKARGIADPDQTVAHLIRGDLDKGAMVGLRLAAGSTGEDDKASEAPRRRCCPTTGDALVDVDCLDAGDRVTLRLPERHAWHPVTWGAARRVRFSRPGHDHDADIDDLDGEAGEDGSRDDDGMVEAAGDAGVTVRDRWGRRHHLYHGDYADAQALEKAARSPWTAAAYRLVVLQKGKPLGAGERWITVHPGGHKSEKGVPVLIKDAGDGTYRVIGGAGGTLSYLRINKAELDAREEERKKTEGADRKAKDAAKKADQAGDFEKTVEGKSGQEQVDAIKEQRQKRQEVELAHRLAERKAIEWARDNLGGVEADLDEDELKKAGYSSGAINMRVSQHHKRQMNQVQEAIAGQRDKLVELGKEQSLRADEARRDLASMGDEVLQEAVSLAEGEIEARADELQEQKAERTAERGAARTRRSDEVREGKLDERLDALAARVTGEKGGDPLEVARAAAEEIETLGGHDDDPKSRIPDSAADETVRRAMQDYQDAFALKAVHDAGGEVPDDPVVQAAYERFQKRVVARNPDGDHEKQLVGEIARLARRGERQEITADKLRAIENDSEKGPAAAWRCREFADLAGSYARDSAEMRRMGLGEHDAAAVQPFEVEVAREALTISQSLRTLRKEFKEAEDAVARGQYDKTRTTFSLQVGDPLDEQVELKVREQVQADLNRGLTGLADSGRSATVSAVASGRYSGLAEMTLGLTDQRYIDRVTLDAVGLENASILTAWGLQQDGIDAGAAKAALEETIVDQQVTEAQRAIAAVEELVPGLPQMVEGGQSIRDAIKSLDVAEADIDSAQETVGAAIGRLEGIQAMTEALRRPVPDQLTIKADDIDSALKLVHGAGLRPGDYSVEPAIRGKDGAPDTAPQVTVKRDQWHKLVRRTPADEIQRNREARAIRAGKADEPGWLPAGFTSRTPESFAGEPGDPPRAFTPLRLESGGDWHASVSEHVGRRLLDGETPRSIYADLTSATTLRDVADREQYQGVLAGIFPTKDADGKSTVFSQHAEHFEALARSVGEATGAGGLNAQSLDMDHEGTSEAVFRALADDPRALVAFKDPAELNHADRRALKEHFYSATGHDPARMTEDAAWKARATRLHLRPAFENDPDMSGSATPATHPLAFGPYLPAEEPDKYDVSKAGAQAGLFGGWNGPTDENGKPINPEWVSYNERRNALIREQPWVDRDAAVAALGARPEEPEAAAQWDAEKARAEGAVFKPYTPWERYVDRMGGMDHAVRAMQEDMRGGFAGGFQRHYAQVTGQTLGVGTEAVHQQMAHLAGMARPGDQEAIQEAVKQSRSVTAEARTRQAGRFATETGDLRARIEAERARSERAKEQQGGLFGARIMAPAAGPAVKAPEIRSAPGERPTLGRRVENQLTDLARKLAPSFEHGKPDVFPGLSMDQGDRIHQQRTIKQALKTRTLGGYLGTGSGKTAIMFGIGTEAMSKGETKHTLITTPANVVLQMPPELASFTEPGRYKAAVASGKSFDERIAMLADTGTHFKIFGHESLRDTVLEAVSRHHGLGSPQEAVAKLSALNVEGRAKMVRDAMAAHGVEPGAFMVDEADKATWRGGTNDKALGLVVQALAHPSNSTHRVMATATPHRNDLGEVHAMATLLRPEKYGDRADFMADWKGTADAPSAIQREMAAITYTAKIPPKGVRRIDQANPVIGADGRKTAGEALKPSGAYAAHIAEYEDAYQRADEARKAGRTDLAALRKLSPRSFEGVDEAKHEEIGKRLNSSLAFSIRGHAMRRAINLAPPEINQKLQRMADTIEHDIKNGEWTDIKTGEAKKGKPSIVFTNRKEEVDLIMGELERRGIAATTIHGSVPREVASQRRQDYNAGKYQVLVGTRSIEAGLNLQAGKVVHNYDVPDTYASWQQRVGRAYRQKQRGDVDTHDWYTDHESETGALRRLREKRKLGDVFETPLFDFDEHGIGEAYGRHLAAKHGGAA